MRECTVLVIGHRYNTIAQADRIVILEDGRIVEAGISDVLTLSGDAFARTLGAVSTSEVSV
jgi:ABC-type transport system involved in Fe-S cluster assembly fused permease/ATPase subunit